MKKLHLSLLCTLALSLAACASPAAPGSLSALGRLPDASCVTQSGADWAPTSISVSRFSAPTAPNANVSFTVSGPATVSARVVTLLGVSVSPNSFTAGSSRLVPITVTISPANGPGTYAVTLYWKSSTQGTGCAETAQPLSVTAY